MYGNRKWKWPIMWWDPRTVVQEITAIEDSLYYTSKCPKEEHKCRWRNMYIESHWNPGNQENDGRGILHWTVKTPRLLPPNKPKKISWPSRGGNRPTPLNIDMYLVQFLDKQLDGTHQNYGPKESYKCAGNLFSDVNSEERELGL